MKRYVSIEELINNTDRETLLAIRYLVERRLQALAGNHLRYVLQWLWREKHIWPMGALPFSMLLSTIFTLLVIYQTTQPIDYLLVQGVAGETIRSPSGIIVTASQPRSELAEEEGYLNLVVELSIENRSAEKVLTQFVLVDRWGNEYLSWGTIPVEGEAEIPSVIEPGLSASGVEIFIVPEAAVNSNVHLEWQISLQEEEIDIQLSGPPFEPYRQPIQEAVVPRYQEQS